MNPPILLSTTTDYHTITHGRSIERAGKRLYALVQAGANLLLYYSDDEGATWSASINVVPSTYVGVMLYDPTNDRLNIVYSAPNTSSSGVAMKAITSNVTSGVPGALTAETLIDAGGANLGFTYPELVHSDTVTNPRYWIIGMKQTGATAFETRVLFVAAGSAADTAGNWSSVNFTNLGGNSNTVSNHMGNGVSWNVAGSPKVTFVFQDTTTGAIESVTFDPTAATPTPGTVTAVVTNQGNLDYSGHTPPMSIAAKDDYLVYYDLDFDDLLMRFLKTVDGITWSQPSGWAPAGGRAAVAKFGSDFLVLHGDLYGQINISETSLSWRKITAATDTMGPPNRFTAAAGNTVSIPRVVGPTERLPGLFMGGFATPWSIRFNSVSIEGNVDSADYSYFPA